MVTEAPTTNSQACGRAALAYAARGIPVLPCHWPTPQDFPHFCSCADLDCPDPARHPIDPFTTKATHDLSQLSRWWLAHPNANPATITDTDNLGVIELRHFARPDHVVRLLKANQIQRGPLLIAGVGRLQFLVRPDHAKLGLDTPKPTQDAMVTALPPGTVVLLAPSRLMSGYRLTWMYRFEHTSLFPAATPLLAQLTDLAASGAFDDPYPFLVL